MSKRALGILVGLISSGTAIVVGCGTSAARPSFSDDACVDGSSRICTCDDGKNGTQFCAAGDNGTTAYAACTCDVAVADAGPNCGDKACTGGETCTSCPGDCGECPKCPAAPTCTNALGIPSSTTERVDLDDDETKVVTDAGADGGTDGGIKPEPSSEGCQDPQLRLRLKTLTTFSGGATVYCVVNTSDGVTSEVALTSKTKSLSDGEVFAFDPAVGTMWGQKALQTTTNNLSITYNCFRVKDDSWSQVLKAAGDAAAQAGGYAGPYGWAFGLGSIGADVAAAAVQAGSGDELVFNAQQVIDKSKLLDLTNARSWSLRKKHDGGFFGYSWDWKIEVESWGCAAGTPPGQR